MYGCAALVAVAVILALVTHASVLLFALPCVLMMGAMVWMMMGGMGNPRGGRGGGPG
ncbi:MAG: hypothetical protein JWO90_45 [Solirubrobacterales bacterium]|nr:hypothetical protein [Solirubrobacterales bacterium]